MIFARARYCLLRLARTAGDWVASNLDSDADRGSCRALPTSRGPGSPPFRGASWYELPPSTIATSSDERIEGRRDRGCMTPRYHVETCSDPAPRATAPRSHGRATRLA